MPQPDYSLPPWEQESADPAKFWLAGLQQGASIQHAKNALDLQAQTTALETSVKQQQSQQSAMLEQEQLEQQHAYKTATLGLQQQELQQAQQKIALQTQQAAQAFVSQRAYQSEVQSLMQTNPNMDEGTASMMAWLRTYGGQKGSGGGMASVSKALASRAPIPDNLTMPRVTQLDIGGGRRQVVITKPGSNQMLLPKDQTGGGNKLDMTDLGYMRKQRDALAKELAGADYASARKAELTPVEKLGENTKAELAAYRSRKAELEKMDAKLEAIHQRLAAGGEQPTGGDDWDMNPTPQAPSKPLPKVTGFKVSGAPTATTTAPTPPQAAPPAAVIPSIPGISDEKPTSQAERKAQARAGGASFAYAPGEVEAARKKYDEKIAKRAYDETKTTAAERYKDLKLYAAKPENTTMTEQEYQRRRAELASLLSKLTPEDRKAITGE